MKTSLLLITCLFLSFISTAQNSLNAHEVLNKSIDYHDPKGKLSSKSWEMYYEDGSYFKYHPRTHDSQVKRTIKEHEVILSIKNEVFKATIDGSSDPKNIDIDSKYTSKKRAFMMRNYYHYLWFLPMKLKDDGTILHNEVKNVDFFGKPSLQLKVTYSPEVGKDIWYFYFNPESFALQGYRFYHDEKVNDGEYILLDGEVSYKRVKIPKSRKWYTHKEDKFLGEDILAKLVIH